MNDKQKYVLLIGVGFIFLMGLFPPFYEKGYHVYSGYYFFTSTGKFVGLIFVPIYIDFLRLCLQWFLIALMTGALFVVMKDKPKIKESEISQDVSE